VKKQNHSGRRQREKKYSLESGEEVYLGRAKANIVIGKRKEENWEVC